MRVIGISGMNKTVDFKRRELPDLDSRSYRIVQGLDAAAALVTDDGVVAAAAEERFTGRRRQATSRSTRSGTASTRPA